MKVVKIPLKATTEEKIIATCPFCGTRAVMGYASFGFPHFYDEFETCSHFLSYQPSTYKQGGWALFKSE